MILVPAIVVALPPLLAAFLAIVLYNDPKPIKYIALGASLISLVLTLYLFVYSQNTYQSFNWFSISGYSFGLSTSTAPLNAMLLLLVSIVTPVVFLYSIGYMQLPSEQGRFYSEMCIFAAAMMLFAISASLLTMFIAWELLGITSYLLIGFYYRKNEPPNAARKAITTIIIGDIAMLAAIILILNAYHSLEYSVILSSPQSAQLSLAMALMLIAIFTKSAQFPFHEWLSDAMEGPTPVSSFLHSSTMVKAGVFLVIVLLPLFQESGLSNVILAVGLISALIGAGNALTERHVKKVLAYSTIEDLGLMLVALGLGSLFAAIMLFIVQTFYKAALFFSAGIIIKANDGREDLYNLYNSAYNKFIFALIAISALSIAAFPPFGGFFAKSAIEDSAMPNLAIYAVLMLIGLATSIYIFRWLILPARHNRAETGNEGFISFYVIPKSMRAPMVIMVVLIIASSAVYLYLPGYLSGIAAPAQVNAVDAAISTIVSSIGIAAAYFIYRKNRRVYLSSTHRYIYAALHNSTITNSAYVAITAVVTYVAEAVAKFDYEFDKAVYSTASYFVAIGKAGRSMVNGQVNTYVLAFVLGIAIIAIAFLV
jgi:NADH-quinone oxidoreductase subunit L